MRWCWWPAHAAWLSHCSGLKFDFTCTYDSSSEGFLWLLTSGTVAEGVWSSRIRSSLIVTDDQELTGERPSWPGMPERSQTLPVVLELGSIVRHSLHHSPSLSHCPPSLASAFPGAHLRITAPLLSLVFWLPGPHAERGRLSRRYAASQRYFSDGGTQASVVVVYGLGRPSVCRIFISWGQIQTLETPGHFNSGS